MKKLTLALIAVLSIQIGGCATTTNKSESGVERRQLLLLPESQVESMSLQSYQQTLKEADSKKTLNTDAAALARVREISNRLIAQTPVFRPDAKNWKWEINVEKNPQVNAYCMPGGKIMVFTGLIDQIKPSDDELAVVIGHEISHALREHGRERMSQAYVQQFGLQALAAFVTGSVGTAAVQAAGMGSQLFFALPNSRTQETEADRMGLELAARAGYNPQSAIALWTKMSKLGGNKPPAYLSDHPADGARISDLQKLMPKMLPLYEQAKAK